MNSMLSVIKFTFMSKLRSKSFRVMSLVIFILLTVIINLPSLIGKLSSDDTVQISAADDDASGGKTESQMFMAYALVYALLFLLYMGVIGFGNMVAMEITAEKSSRVMEILITSVSPLKQMFGKIIGICLLALLQIAAIILVAIANLSIPANGKLIEELHLNWSDV